MDGQRPSLSVGRTWWRAWSWIVLGAVLVGAYALAVVFGRGPDIGHRMLDALRLFPQFPGVDNGHRWEYILARQLAAIVLLAVTIGVVAALLSDRIAELRARFRRDHAVVCGLGETGLRNALAFRAQGIPTTCIELKAKGDATEAARNAGALILHRDTTQVSTLENARVDRADRQSAARARTARTACEPLPRGGGIECLGGLVHGSPRRSQSPEAPEGSLALFRPGAGRAAVGDSHCRTR